MTSSKKEVRESHVAKFEKDLREFSSSLHVVLRFPSWVNSWERKRLHASALNLGFWGQSFGRKQDRALHVFKTPQLKLAGQLSCHPEMSCVISDDVSYVELCSESRNALWDTFSSHVPQGWLTCMDHVAICRGTLKEARSHDDRCTSDEIRENVQALSGGMPIALRVTCIGRDLGVLALGVIGCHTMNQTSHVVVACSPGHSAIEGCSVTDWEILDEDKMIPLFGIIRNSSRQEARTLEPASLTRRDHFTLPLGAPLVLHRKSGVFTGDLQNIAAQVVDVLSERGWEAASSTSALATDLSGFGCGKTYKVVCESAKPPAVALHVFGESANVQSTVLERIEDAALIFANAALAPCRLAHGEGWFIEQWGGVTLKPTPTSRLGSLQGIREIGALLAKIHAIPPTWYDKWREQLCASMPELFDANSASHIWWYANSPQNDKLPNLSSDALARWTRADFFAPVTKAAARVVTCHGDFHPANIIRIDGMLKVIDFEFAGAAAAAHEFASIFARGWVAERDEKVALVKSYLEASSFPASPADVDSFLLDAEIAIMGASQFVLWPGLERNSLIGDGTYKNPCYPHAFEEYFAFVGEVRSKLDLQSKVVARGLRTSIDEWFQVRVDEKRRVDKAKWAMLAREEGLRRKALARVCACCKGVGNVIGIGTCPLCDGVGILE